MALKTNIMMLSFVIVQFQNRLHSTILMKSRCHCFYFIGINKKTEYTLFQFEHFQLNSVFEPKNRRARKKKLK